MWCEIIQINTKLIQLLPFKKIASKPGTRKKDPTAHCVIFSNVVSISKYLHIQFSSPQLWSMQSLATAHLVELFESKIAKQIQRECHFQRERKWGSRTAL